MLFFVWFYFYRRGIMPVLIMALFDHPIFQIMLILYLQLFYLIFILHVRVFKSPSEQRKEVLNEAVTLTILYMLLPMTGAFVDKPESKDKIGWAMIILTLTNFTANIFPVVVGMLCMFKLKCTRCMNRRAHAAQMKENEEKAEQAKKDAECALMNDNLNKMLNGDFAPKPETPESEHSEEDSSSNSWESGSESDALSISSDDDSSSLEISEDDVDSDSEPEL